MIDDSEQDRLRRAHALDRKTLAAIYDEFYDPLYRYVFRQTGDVESSQDIVAEVFRCFLQALQRGTGPQRHLKAWLYRAAHNAVVDHYRYRRIRQHLPLDEQRLAATEDPVQDVEEHMVADHVRQALSRLTREQQQVLTLKFLAGFSNAEIAAVIDKPIGAVKSLQHRGLATLRRHLGPVREKTL